MKTEYLFVILLVLIGFSSCEDSTSDATLELSQSTFENISSDGATLTVNITSSDSWTAASSSTACNLVPNQGTSNQSLSIVVEANLDEAERNMTVVVTSGGIKKTISISQQGRSTTAGEYHYNLPVIFHVLYKDKNNPLQYVKQDRLAKILDTVNKLYKDKTKSVDMNLTFTLATTDEDGKPLSTPGVEYVLWEESYPIDCDVFMNDETGKYVKYIWEPNNYINVMVYNFKDDESTNSTTLGIAHIPFSTVGSNYLEGLSKTQKSYLEKQNLKFPYSVSINSLFINDQSTSTQYGCFDSDYCDDTPTYNKVEYDADYAYTAKNDPANFTFDYLVKRKNCKTNQTFTSTNIMDYSVSYSDRFTNDQRSRIRHVLTYSPLIPGPKQGQTQTRSVVEGPIDLPIRTAR